MKNLIFVLMGLVIGCSQPAKDAENTFIVPPDTLHVTNRLDRDIPLPAEARDYYFPSNFIIDTGGHLYFYQQHMHYGWRCGVGMEWELPPPFIDLQPKDIIEVPGSGVEQFIKLNIQYLDEQNRGFAIASTADTITSAGLAKIFAVFKDKTNHIRWIFRRTTQEEEVVLDYKKRGESYFADSIGWDSTRMQYPPRQEVTQFKPPKIED